MEKWNPTQSRNCQLAILFSLLFCCSYLEQQSLYIPQLLYWGFSPIWFSVSAFLSVNADLLLSSYAIDYFIICCTVLLCVFLKYYYPPMDPQASFAAAFQDILIAEAEQNSLAGSPSDDDDASSQEEQPPRFVTHPELYVPYYQRPPEIRIQTLYNVYDALNDSWIVADAVDIAQMDADNNFGNYDSGEEDENSTSTATTVSIEYSTNTNGSDDSLDSIGSAGIRHVYESELDWAADVWLRHTSREMDEHCKMAPILSAMNKFSVAMPMHASSISHLESIFLTLGIMADAQTMGGVTAALAMYVKGLNPAWQKQGLVASIMAELFPDAMSLHDATEGPPQEDPAPEWLSLLKSGQSNWKLMKNNPFFGNISKVCSLLISLGLCNAASLDFSMGGHQLFAPRIAAKHASAYDLFDALSETLIYFVEGGYKCYIGGSIAPLLLGDDEISDLVSQCTKCELYGKAQKNGNLNEVSGIMFDDNKLDTMFQDTIKQCTRLYETTESIPLRKVLLDKRSRLELAYGDFQETRVKGGLRIQPYCIGFWGKSCQGKSSVAALYMSVILRHNGFAYNDNSLVTLNANDKYWSSFKTNTTGAFLDDMGNENPKFCQVNPTRIVLDLINNVRMYANKAELDAKGRVSVEPFAVAITKNVQDGNAPVYSCEPVAITRRENFTVKVVARDEYCVDGKLDSRLTVKCPMVKGFQDLWKLSVEVSYGVNETGAKHDQVAYKLAHHKGKQLKDITILELLSFLMQDSKSWYKEQRKLVARSKEVTTHLEWCSGCESPGALCHCEVPPLVLANDGDSDSDDDDDRFFDVAPETPASPPVATPTDNDVPALETPPLIEDDEEDDPDMPPLQKKQQDDDSDDEDDDAFDENGPPSTAWDRYYNQRNKKRVFDPVLAEYQDPPEPSNDVFAKPCRLFSCEHYDKDKDQVYDPTQGRFIDRPPPASNDAWANDVNDETSEEERETAMNHHMAFDLSVLGSTVLYATLFRFFSSWKKLLMGFVPIFMRDVDKVSAAEALEFLEYIECSYLFLWTSYIPEKWIGTSFIKSMIFKRASFKDWFWVCWREVILIFATFMFTFHMNFLPTFNIPNVLWSFTVLWTMEIYRTAKKRNTTTDDDDLNPSVSWWEVVWDCIICIVGWCGAILFGGCSNSVFAILLAMILSLMYHDRMEICKQRLFHQVTVARDANPAIFNKYRENYVQGFLILFSSAAVLYAAVKALQAWNYGRQTQASLTPETYEDVKARDELAALQERVAVEHNYDNVQFASTFKADPVASTISFEQLIAKVSKNTVMCCLTCPTTQRNAHLNGFFVSSNALLLPKHVFKEKSCWKVKFICSTTDVRGADFEARIYKSYSIPIPNKDYVLVYVPSGGSWADLSKYLVHEQPTAHNGVFIHRKTDGQLVRMNVSPEDTASGNIVTKWLRYKGFEYLLPIKTQEGLCMSPIVGMGKVKAITGFHLAGYTGTQRGASATFTKSEYTTAWKALDKIHGVLLSKSKADQPDRIMDVEYCTSPNLHPKSPYNEIKDPEAEFLGDCIGRATFRSQVHKTIISESVEMHTGQGCDWRPPPIVEAKPWSSSLEYLCHPTKGVPAALLQRACADLQATYIGILNKIPEVKAMVRPLTRVETVSGIDGCRFIDAIKWNTAIGFPFGAKKETIKVKLDPDEHPDHECPMDVQEEFWDQAEKIKDEYRKGDTSFEVFKACLKDEPVHKDKVKVRIFQACPMALALLIRMYFLPVARLLSMFPLISECAVGINPHGPEWWELRSHVATFGIMRILAGDYSKYDLSMSAMLTLAAFGIMINIAAASGNYTEDDLDIMRGLATDVCYPKVAYNGDLMQFNGSNPSGHNLTVYINSIVNSLLFRCGFFFYYPKAVVFNLCVKLATYGDDALSSVHKDYPLFNHISFAKFLAACGMKFTMPDKTSTPTEYMHDRDADFLKTRSVWCPALDTYLGALDEQSIFKSLHCVGGSSLTNVEQAIANIDGAMREWFNHGEVVYELRRAQMQLVAQDHGLIGWCKELGVTYDQAVQRWIQRYRPEEMVVEETFTPMVMDSIMPTSEAYESLSHRPQERGRPI